MRAIKKHNFEPVSLLTVENGVLDVAIIPAYDQPDWLVPTSLLMHIEEYDERIWTYLWRGQEVSVYHLAQRGKMVDKLIILEGNTEVHRLALQTFGDITYKQVRISDVKDAVLPEDEKAHMMANIPNLFSAGHDEHKLDYMYQAVKVEDSYYIVPDLDIIAHRLVDLDS